MLALGQVLTAFQSQMHTLAAKQDLSTGGILTFSELKITDWL